MRMGNKHNEDNAFRLKRTFRQKICKLRDFWLENQREWAPAQRTMALEAVGFANPSANDVKSQGECFRLASVDDELWQVVLAMMSGNYVQYGKRLGAKAPKKV